jgi:hypothetical protein
MQFVENKEGKFHLVEKTVEHLKNICRDKQVCVVIVVGRYRSGKSFLLNRLIGEKEFKTSSSVNSETKGIFCSSQLIDDKFLLFDVEGAGATDVDNQNDTNIFVLSLLISSVFVFNTVGAVDSSSLEQLQLFTNVSKLINFDSQRHRPKLVYLSRDFSLQLKNRNGETLTPGEYLKSSLGEKKEIQKSVDDIFCSSEFASLPTPQNVENLDFMRSSSKLDKNFELKLSELRKILFEKENRGNSIEIVLQIASKTIESINLGKLPTIGDIWTVCQELIEKNAKSKTVEFLANRLCKIPVTNNFVSLAMKQVFVSIDFWIDEMQIPPSATSLLEMVRYLTVQVETANSINIERQKSVVNHSVEEIRKILPCDINEIGKHVKFCQELVLPFLNVIFQHYHNDDFVRLQMESVKREENLLILTEENNNLQKQVVICDEQKNVHLNDLRILKQELEEQAKTHEAFEEDVVSDFNHTKMNLENEQSKTLEAVQKSIDLDRLLNGTTKERDFLKQQLSETVQTIRVKVEKMQEKSTVEEALSLVQKEKLENTEKKLEEAKNVCFEQKQVLAKFVLESKNRSSEEKIIQSDLKKSLLLQTTELAIVSTKLSYLEKRWKKRQRSIVVDNSNELIWLNKQHDSDSQKISELAFQICEIQKELMEIKVVKLLF